MWLNIKECFHGFGIGVSAGAVIFVTIMACIFIGQGCEQEDLIRIEPPINMGDGIAVDTPAGPKLVNPVSDFVNSIIPHARYKEDVVDLPAGTELHYDNLTMVTKYPGRYFSERYENFSHIELMRVLIGDLDVNDVKPAARWQRWQEFIKRGGK